MSRPFHAFALVTLLLGASLASAQSAPSPTSSPSPSPSASLGKLVTIVIPPGAENLGPQAYGANPLIILPGTTVTWINNDTVPHTVFSDDGSVDSGTMQPGETFSRTFDEPGTFKYFCFIHGKERMSGAILITATPPSPSASPSATPSVAPLASASASPAASPSPSPSPSSSASPSPTVTQPPPSANPAAQSKVS